MCPGRLGGPPAAGVLKLVLRGPALGQAERAGGHAPAHAQAHQAERPEIIAREPGHLVDRAQRGQPGLKAELAAAPVAERADRVVVLHHEAAPGHLGVLRNRLPGEVQIAGGDHVDACRVLEEPELGADPGVEVQQLVLVIPGVPAQVEVHDPAVAHAREHLRDLVAQPGVRRGASHAGQPGVGRVGPLLGAGERGPAHRAAVAVAVEEPVAGGPPGDELLQHQPDAGRGAGAVGLVERVAVGQDRGAAEPAAAAGPRRGQLGDQGEARLGGKLAGFLRRLGYRGLDRRHADLAAQLVQRVLACDPPGEITGRVGEQEPRPQLLAVLGQEDRARVVGRHQHGALPDPVGQLLQARLHPLHVVRARLPEAAAAQVTGTRRRRPRPLVHAVDRHALAAETTDDAEAAVVHDVRIELQHHRRRSRVHAVWQSNFPLCDVGHRRPARHVRLDFAICVRPEHPSSG